MRVGFHSHRSQRQSAKQQKPGRRSTFTVGANPNFCRLKAFGHTRVRLTLSTRLSHFTTTTPEGEFVVCCLHQVEWERTNSGVKSIEMTVLILVHEGPEASAKSLNPFPHESRLFFLEMAV